MLLLCNSLFRKKNFANIFTLVGIGAADVGIFPENTGTPQVISALIVFICGGVRVNVVKDALKTGADILVVGRAITASKDIKCATDEFIEHMDKEEIDQFGVLTDF